MKLYLLLTILLLAACGGASAPDSGSDVPPAQDSGNITYLALGDSYTIGQSVEIEDRWPVILAGDLKKYGKALKSPDIIATTGWTTRNLLDALDQHAPEHTYDLVSLMIGVNNQYQGRSIDEYRTQLRELLDRSIAYAGGEPGRVFVLSIPDYGVTPFGGSDGERIGREIDAFNAVCKDECTQKKVLFMDITPLSREAKGDLSMLARDQLHYSGKMHQKWVDAILPQVKALL